MAVNLQQTVSIDLGSVVANSVLAVKTTRRSEQARKEAEFQRAIADGLSYEAQVSMRESQLADEKDSSFQDAEYVLSLEKSIADTKKLNRFNTYRTKYADTLGQLGAGKINEEQYLSVLKNQLAAIDDPELRLEVQTDIATAEAKVKTYTDTILSNQVKKATYDGTKKSLSDAIAKVNVARAKARVSNNEDEVSAYDETLAALNAQRSAVGIQDSITDFQVHSATRGTNPVEKLHYVTSEIQKADPDTPVKIGDRTYTSAQQYWSLERDSFLAGNSQLLGNFFGELNTYTKNVIDASTVKFGYPTQAVLDDTLQTFNELKAKPEMIPFVNRLDVTQATVMNDAVTNFAKAIADSAETTQQFNFVDTQLETAAAKYGVDTTIYRSQLFQKVRGLEQAGLIAEGSAANLAAKLQINIPEITKTPTPAPASSVAPSSAPAAKPADTGGEHTVGAGDTLSGIAQKAGTTLQQVLDLNPQYKENPALIRPGEKVVLPSVVPPVAPPAPAPAETKPVTPEPSQAPVPKPTATPKPLPVGTPTSTPIPVTPTTPSAYTGTSVVDYLKSQKQDSSYASRAKLATEKGITGYTGTPKQNEDLLKFLRG